MKSSDYKNRNTGIAKALSILIQLGLTMACTVIVAMLIGKFIDSKIGGGNRATLIFMFIGIFAALRNMFVIVRGIGK